MTPSPPSSDSLLPDGPNAPSGLAAICDETGRVVRVIECTDEAVRIAAGASIFSALDPSSLDVATLFLRTLAKSGFARSLGVRMRPGLVVHLFGLRRDEGLLVAAVVDPLGAAIFCDAMARRAPNDAAALLDLAEQIRAMDSSYALYEELARLNNDLVTTQRELARTVAELERANAYKNELLGMAAHDLLNPLTASLGLVNFLYEDLEQLSEANAGILDQLRSNTTFMARLVNDVLDFSSLETGQVRLRRQPVHLDALVHGVVETMRILAARKQITIEYYAAELPALQLDDVKLAQSVHNLIGNAVKFSPREKTVTVRVSRDATRVCIEVSDEGPGIPAHELQQLFKPFTRLTPQAIGGDRSTGLGLSITKRLVEAHGGRIEVDSVVGRGTTFRLFLPAQQT